LVAGFVIAKPLINLLASHRIRQVFRTRQQVKDLAILHGQKLGVSTMGGIVVMIASLLSMAIWASFNDLVIMALMIYAVCSLLGAIDDILKIVREKSLGLTSWQKLFAQLLITALVLYVARESPPINNLLTNVEWSWFYGRFDQTTAYALIAVFYFLVIAGTSNGVNITDGIDGLAITNITQCFVFFTIVAFYSCDVGVAARSTLAYIGGAGELAVLCACFAGGCLAFTRFNWYPASVFMGDMGAIGLGGLLAGVAMLLRQPFILILVGLIFVVETVSVALQITSKRVFKRKIFLMAPLHHHFELSGYSERRIVKVTFVIQAICVAAALYVTFHGCIGDS
jgi:phospho-N-acetylmuramoyl-pentapeptide-transferase